ncbi:MAG: acyltransferase [Muribaculaceae bacterium]
MEQKEIITPEEFADICPIDDKDFKQRMAQLVKDPGFRYFVEFILPEVDYDAYTEGLLKLDNTRDFQLIYSCQYLEKVEHDTTSGITSGGIENLNPEKAYSFITNHRDIVLDASFINLVLARNNFPTTEVAIGNNLLAYDWIETLVKINKSFIVKRDTTTKGRLAAAIQLSRYIHFAINQKHDSIWIAQRQGRAKDSNDLTQDSVIKMLTIGGESKDFIQNVKELSIAPISLSYEFDPNDYLKATEFLMRKKDPDFKKSQNDDILSMLTGLRGFKGHIHFQFAPCINEQLDEIPADLDKQEKVHAVCNIIDKAIHSNYKIFPCNYIAYDRMNGTQRFADKYTDEDLAYFDKYLNRRIEKVKVPTNDEDKEFMRQRIVEMYANPLINKLKALGEL